MIQMVLSQMFDKPLQIIERPLDVLSSVETREVSLLAALLLQLNTLHCIPSIPSHSVFAYTQEAVLLSSTFCNSQGW